MKKIIIASLFMATSAAAFAQYRERDREREKEKDEKEESSFKENLFTGGSISLAFYNNTFLIGASPVFGYSVANWVDAGIVVNYTYTSYRDVNAFDDKLHQTVYGGGGFVKLYPVRFLFAQAQYEHNNIRQKYIPPGGGFNETARADANSFLIGGGYTTGREGKGGAPFYYLAVLFDVSHNAYSPYTDAYGRSIPIIRAGLQVPLFQGEKGRRR
jgi:hypothetical protein